MQIYNCVEIIRGSRGKLSSLTDFIWSFTMSWTHQQHIQQTEHVVSCYYYFFPLFVSNTYLCSCDRSSCCVRTILSIWSLRSDTLRKIRSVFFCLQLTPCPSCFQPVTAVQRKHPVQNKSDIVANSPPPPSFYSRRQTHTHTFRHRPSSQ